MNKFIVTGGKPLIGEITVSGAKNVALKALVAACLTDEEVTIHNIPQISDFFVMVDILKELGAKVHISDHTARIRLKQFTKFDIPLDKAALARTSSMFIAPLLARKKEAIIPNPGGCRLGARPIDRIIDGLKTMHATITYNSQDGYFHAKTAGLQATTFTFKKNTHTGTETMILASVLAQGTTVLENAAEEPEIDELIHFLNNMGAKITRSQQRQITIVGVKKLHGTTFSIGLDRNEIVTFAIAAVVTRGNIVIKDAATVDLTAFLAKLNETGAHFEISGRDIRFFANGLLHAADVTTAIYPGFMTDWQAPWAVLMTQAHGKSIIHETVFEDKLGYIEDLKKMGATVMLFNPVVEHPENVYNFNLKDDKPTYFHAVAIHGPASLHDAVVSMRDLRAGAAIVLAALAARGTSIIFGIEKLDRGYEKFEERLRKLGADIKRVTK